jgi:hypothetical protein
VVARYGYLDEVSHCEEFVEAMVQVRHCCTLESRRWPSQTASQLSIWSAAQPISALLCLVPLTGHCVWTIWTAACLTALHQPPASLATWPAASLFLQEIYAYLHPSTAISDLTAEAQQGGDDSSHAGKAEDAGIDLEQGQGGAGWPQLERSESLSTVSGEAVCCRL